MECITKCLSMCFYQHEVEPEYSKSRSDSIRGKSFNLRMGSFDRLAGKVSMRWLEFGENASHLSRYRVSSPKILGLHLIAAEVMVLLSSSQAEFAKS